MLTLAPVVPGLGSLNNKRVQRSMPPHSGVSTHHHLVNLSPEELWMTWTSLAQHSTSIGPSPIAMMTKDERTSRFLARIALQLDMLRDADAAGKRAEELVLSLEEIAHVRARWEDIVLRGEQQLHVLASNLAEDLLQTENIQRVARVVAGPKEEI